MDEAVVTDQIWNSNHLCKSFILTRIFVVSSAVPEPESDGDEVSVEGLLATLPIRRRE